RLLDPRTAAQYSYQAWYIRNARRYNSGGRALQIGDPVEVELPLSPDAINTLRGKVLYGKLTAVEQAGGKALDADAWDRARLSDEADVEQWTFVVDIDGSDSRFRYADDARAERDAPPGGVAWCRQVLLDFRQVGIEVLGPHQLRYTLEHPTPYFLKLMGFYPLFPVPRHAIERYGSPDWTDVERLVGNGPFVPLFRQIRDRTRLAKSDTFWDREN
ncbi:MAG TPA: hypothetical protein PKC18_14635, partial [Lacipirellulaceae bacterium]|nr:hypothetical protein [Lacipirellulaceae bacterium]